MNLVEKVEKILETYPNTRDSDTKLTIMVWWQNNQNKLKIVEGIQYVALKDILDMESAESIGRARRKIQEEGRWLSSEQVALERAKREEEMRQNMPQVGWNIGS